MKKILISSAWLFILLLFMEINGMRGAAEPINTNRSVWGCVSEGEKVNIQISKGGITGIDWEKEIVPSETGKP